MINNEIVSNLKSWPFKEALQIIKKNGGLQNFKTPEKVCLQTTSGGLLADYLW